MNITIRKDGHIHSPYCPHGTKDPFEKYIQNAIKNNLTEMSFTEHLPFNCEFYDKKVLDCCALSFEDAYKYINDVLDLKEKYKDKIKINLGFEVDYVDSHEKDTMEILNRYGKYIDDSILSVHFVMYENEYYAIDSRKDFKKLLEKCKSLDKIYDIYFECLLKSIRADLGIYKPKRIGHPTLVRIFNLMYPHEYKNISLINEIIKEIKDRDYEIDINTAGLRKPYCKEIYPSGLFKEIAIKNNIRAIYGSDSHTADDVCKDFIF